MTFQDIFKSTFIEAFSTTNVSVSTVIPCFLIAAGLGAYLFFLYQFISKKTFYDKSFNMSIPILAVIVCATVLTIQSNIVLSLGMVGALSIVRFRTAVKSPMDLIFLFWAIAIGIICGASLHIIAIIVSAGLTVGLLIMEYLPIAKVPMLLVVNATEKETKDEIEHILQLHTKRYHIKSQTIETNRLVMIVEIAAKNNDVILDEITQIPTVTRCSLVSHDGEVTC